MPRQDVTCRSYAHTIAHAVVSEVGPASALAGGSGIGVFRRGNVHIPSGILAPDLRSGRVGDLH
ncbi:hypothetical protein [Rhodococcus sp. 24CO]|uniref:hypothetical protein n=1 Tax=Rhodococcus sp. 24CO TaxID=3117460 RepID=UPI003D33796F